jgi:hypothetical protein
MTTVTRPATGENDARPGYGPKPIVSAASAGSLVQFANRKNLPCVSMASLGDAKLANPLMTKAYYCSLGSANDFRDLVAATHTNEDRCLLFVYYSI